MHRLRLLPLVLAATLLAACGTGRPPGDLDPEGPKGPDEPQPRVLAVAPTAAQPGATVTITGEALGAAGAVRLGGLAADVVAWSPEAITIEVPDGAPPAWQPLLVTPDDGGEAEAELFVGVAFTGPESELRDALAALEAGTHLLLPSGTLALPGSELVLDGVHLHGHPDGTTLALGASGVAVLVGRGGAAGLTGVEVHGAYFTFRVPGAGGIVPIALAADEEPGDEPTTVHLERLTFVGGSFGLDAYMTGATARIHLKDSRLVADGIIDLPGEGAVEVTGSQVLAGSVTVASSSGPVTIAGSVLTGRSLTSVVAAERIEVRGSTLTATDGNVSLHATGMGMADLVEGSLLVTGSELEARETPMNGLPDAYSGDIVLTAYGGTIEVLDNPRVQAHDGVEIRALGFDERTSEARVEGNAFLARGVRLVSERAQASFVGNSVTHAGPVEALLSLSGLEATVDVSGNTFTVTDDPGPTATGLRLEAQNGYLSLEGEGNVFTNLSRAFHVTLHDATLDGAFTHNVFDFPIEQAPAAGYFVVTGSHASLDLSGTRWGAVTDSAALADLMEVLVDMESQLTLRLDPLVTD